mgnify:FL=1
MKTFIIYVEGHLGSVGQANRCYNICKDFGYVPTLFAGSTPHKMYGSFNYPVIEKS